MGNITFSLSSNYTLILSVTSTHCYRLLLHNQMLVEILLNNPLARNGKVSKLSYECFHPFYTMENKQVNSSNKETIANVNY